jgi:predicted RNA-binding protein with PUA-like domain
MAKKYWLMKTEPDVFSITDLKNRPGKKEHWDGVRNYQARNNMRDGMSVGDEVLFYHSSCDPAGVAGIATIAKKAYPDPSALDPKSKYHDPKATPEKNPWVMVDVKFVRQFDRIVTLEEMKSAPGLEKMLVIKRGMRLSVQPVAPEEFEIVLKLAEA